MKLNANEVESLFSRFDGMKVLIIGDVMLDKYVHGHIDRISPEAPVPVVVVDSVEGRPGGAGNVAMNIRALGGMPYLLAVTGFDKDGSELNSIFEKNQISTHYLIESPDRLTPVKTRVIAKNQQLIRLDYETTEDIQGKTENSVLQMALEIIEKDTPGVVIFEDYNKGTLTENIITTITAAANAKKIPIAVDPKEKNFLSYRNCTLFKPNLRELRESIAPDLDDRNTDALSAASRLLHEKLSNRISLLTLGEHGIFVDQANEQYHIAARLRDIADVSGAGDTVISVAALCLACGTDIFTMASIANIAGGLVCEHPGVVQINKQQLLDEVLLLTR